MTHCETFTDDIQQFGWGATHHKVDEDNPVSLSKHATKRFTMQLNVTQKTLEFGGGSVTSHSDELTQFAPERDLELWNRSQMSLPIK